jgi:hypothetical protein
MGGTLVVVGGAPCRRTLERIFTVTRSLALSALFAASFIALTPPFVTNAHAAEPTLAAASAESAPAGAVGTMPTSASSGDRPDSSAHETSRDARRSELGARLGFGVGDRLGFASIGLEGIHSDHLLRLGFVSDASLALFSGKRYAMAAYFGLGDRFFGDHLEAQIGVLGGMHAYEGVVTNWGLHPTSTHVAVLPFVGLRASLDARFGARRQFAIGVVGSLRADGGTATIDEQVCGRDFFGDFG